MPGSRLCVGAITGAYGVRGEVRLRSFCAEPVAIADYGPLWRDNATERISVTITRQIKGGFAARLTGVKTREQAERLRGSLLYADRSMLSDLADDEFYQSDLIGLEVRDMEGTTLGLVQAVVDYGAGDLLDVRLENSTVTVLLPFTAAAVPTVDLESGRIIVDPPLGLFPEPASGDSYECFLGASLG